MPQQESAHLRAHNKDEIELGRVLGILLDNKWLVIAITSLFVAAGVVYALLATPIYRADALIQVEQVGPSNPLADVSSLLGKPAPTQSEIEIIRSRMVLGRVVEILNLDLIVEPVRAPVLGNFLNRIGVVRPDFASGWRYVWAGEALDVANLAVTPSYIGSGFTLRVIDESTYDLHLDDLSLGRGRVGQAAEFMEGDISLTVNSIAAPAGAEFSVARIGRIEAISELRNNLRIFEQGRETGILSWGFTDSDPTRARAILRAIGDIYVSQNIQRQSEEARKSLEFLSQQLPLVQDQLNAAEDLLNSYRAGRESVDLSLETRSVLDRLVHIEAQLNELAFSEAEISRRFTASHPTYSALLEKKAQLQSERENIERRIDRLPETQQEILRLQRDVSVNQEIYVQLRNKVQEMQIAEASTVGNVRVLDHAEVFPRPVEPNRKVLVLLATLFGGIAAVSFVLVRAVFRRGVETQDQIEALGLPVYATIPLSEDQQKANSRLNLGRKKLKRTSLPVGLLAQRNPADTCVEALRGLRTSLHFGMSEDDNNCVMITGPSPNVGKSFVSANLGAVYAQMGSRVLVIDGDMRKGHIHNLFGHKSEGGLSELLSGRHTLEEVIRPAEGIDNMDYIARGTAPPNPAELLSTSRFDNFLTVVSKKYDLVIIDSPPILAVTDAAIIGKKVGATLMVVRFQLNPPKEVELAMHRLEAGGVKIKGAILNALERKAATALGYGYYNYSYK